MSKKNLKIIIAVDSFKGTLSAKEACTIISGEISALLPSANIIIKPMADGGEGTADAMLTAMGGTWIKKEVTGPLPDMKVNAGFAWFQNESTALVEMASASGIQLLSKSQLNPMLTTTYGTGQLIKAALQKKPKKIILAVGGSATVDGGVGAAMALGWNFLDNSGKPIPLGGQGLAQIAKIVKPQILNLVPVEVLCDVDNPLCGPHGGAAVFGPQKGATPEMVNQLENALSHLADLVKTQLNIEIKNVPGSGAAGGLAAGAIAFMNAKLVPGIETVIAQSHLNNELTDADWIITGEGSFDHQSLRGKVVSGIAKVAKKYNVPTAVIAGSVNISPEEYRKFGIIAAVPCRTEGMSLDYALENARELLKAAAKKLTLEYLAK